MSKAFFILLFCTILLKVQAQQSTAPPSAMMTGKTIYMQRCATCHQVDGAGAQNMIPPLINTEYVLGDKTRLIGIILKGLNGEMKVNGEIYGNEMPSHSDLKDSEIAAVLTYVRNSFGNKARPISTTKVKRVRAMKK